MACPNLPDGFDFLDAEVNREGLPVAERETIVHAAVLGRHVSAAALSHLVGRPVRLAEGDHRRHAQVPAGTSVHPGQQAWVGWASERARCVTD